LKRDAATLADCAIILAAAVAALAATGCAPINLSCGVIAFISCNAFLKSSQTPASGKQLILPVKRSFTFAA
jgi:uncharacterized ferredoxin-like protein